MAEARLGLIGVCSYLIMRFTARLTGFLYDWYVGGFKVFVHAALSFFESLDRTFALKVTLRYMFRPLYQDRSVIGYALGFFFRALRAVFGALLYAALWIVFSAVYAAWAAAPLAFIYFAFKTYGTA